MSSELTFRADRLKKERELQGISQRELGRRCGIAEIMIHRYESGKADPALSTLRLISEQLQVSSDYLIGLTDDPRTDLLESDLLPNEKALLDAFRKGGWSGAMRLIAE